MILTCRGCGQKNRVGASHLTRTVRCGACKADIAPMTEPIDADAALFDEITASATVPVLVDFWAAWCGPCVRAAPEVKQTAAAVAGRALVLKVDTEQHPGIAARYGVASIPNFVVLRDGRPISQHAGLVDHREMTRWIDAAAATDA
jgi:thioredoxin 2